MRLLLKACPKCGGDVVLAPGLASASTALRCIQCGLTREWSRDELRGVLARSNGVVGEMNAPLPTGAEVDEAFRQRQIALREERKRDMAAVREWRRGVIREIEELQELMEEPGRGG